MTEATTKSPRITAEWLHAPALAKVFAALTAEGAEARVVGGAVRNALINRAVKDIDLATTSRPEEVVRLAQRAGLGAHPTGIDHGTITVVADRRPFEVTTLRRDVETDGRRAIVTFTTSWEEDASRRDFTINALYCSADGTIYDFMGGLDDLRHRRVRFIGDAEARIREDYLRILRFFRFSAEYGKGHLDEAGLAAADALKEGLSLLSAERIRTELLKLLVAPAAADVINTTCRNGILQLVVRTRLEPERFARLVSIEAALGEPAALAVDNPDDAAFLARELRLSNAEASRIAAATAAASDIDPGTPEAAARAVLYKLGAENFARAVRVAWARSGAPSNDPRWRARALLADRWKIPRLPFSGSDILALGVAAGPEVGKILEAFEHWWMAENFPSDAERQSNMLKELAHKAAT
ncbi:MAG TPA: CCA tRNA nucleotidyltransferase [Hyphomicrobium sp.]|nr:CCA tRNA nucleotidyltransferase [Hyphomicrobium sp.]